jgi:hypothetical protein
VQDGLPATKTGSTCVAVTGLTPPTNRASTSASATGKLNLANILLILIVSSYLMCEFFLKKNSFLFFLSVFFDMNMADNE